jgi:hypothetical protein
MDMEMGDPFQAGLYKRRLTAAFACRGGRVKPGASQPKLPEFLAYDILHVF